MIDKDERIRRFINLQYVKMKRMASVGSLILLAVNLAVTLYPYIEFRLPRFVFGFIPRVYLGIFVLFVFITFLIWVGAHVYIRKFGMNRTEHMADVSYNPYAVYQIGPFEEMLYRTVTIPTLEASYSTMKDGVDKDRIKVSLDKAKKWVDLGFIPKDDFPVHLRKYISQNKERRL